MFKKNENNDIVVTKAGVSFIGVLVVLVNFFFGLFTYTLGKATQQTEKFVALQMKIENTVKDVEVLKNDVNEMKKILEEIKSDVRLIKFKLGLNK